ncbi:MAG TPA: beta-galactosidase, partial [Phycisphaerae bacterium]|nr:beta-galactosidase [Phycisphaerae bacterium]
MTTTAVQEHQGLPTLFLNGQPVPPIAAFLGPEYAERFLESDVLLYTFVVPGKWWVGPDRYDFSEVDSFLSDYARRIPGRFFMPRILLFTQGDPWWGELHPGEMNVLRSIETGEVLDQLAPNPRANTYLGHDVKLAGQNLHSFHSRVWREEAGGAVAALVSHCESQPYADSIWGWHLCDGLFHEWFHWSEYAFDGLADYSPAALGDFRRWLRHTYENSPARLSEAWGRQVDFDSAAIPQPQERVRPAHGEFYDPVRDRPTIDYMHCMSDSIVDSITAVCSAAKGAMPRPKVTCVYYGYQFSDMPRPQLNGHYALARLLASPAVDIVASPHAYCSRGEGGYHSPQTVLDSIRGAGKLHFDEIDCKTAWTPTTVTWKRHISQPATVPATIEMLKKEAAFPLASAAGCWWMDLTNNGWFDAPEAAECVRRLRAIEQRLLSMPRRRFGE